MLLPSGHWYFIVLEADDKNFRQTPNNTTITPLLSVLVKAVQNMPMLEYFMLYWPECEETFEMMYFEPGVESGKEDDIDVRRVHYSVGNVWRPNHEIREGLKRAGMERFGGALVERFLE